MSSIVGHNDQVPEEPTPGRSQGRMWMYATVEAWVWGWGCWCPSVGEVGGQVGVRGLGECPALGTQELDLGQHGARGGAWCQGHC